MPRSFFCLGQQEWVWTMSGLLVNPLGRDALPRPCLIRKDWCHFGEGTSSVERLEETPVLGLCCTKLVECLPNMHKTVLHDSFINQACCYTPVIPALGRLKQEDQGQPRLLSEFKVKLVMPLDHRHRIRDHCDFPLPSLEHLLWAQAIVCHVVKTGWSCKVSNTRKIIFCHLHVAYACCHLFCTPFAQLKCLTLGSVRKEQHKLVPVGKMEPMAHFYTVRARNKITVCRGWQK